ncbi:MAG: pilus assembly protein PilP [Smithellaceae bacterium]|nr:pilus assembly protein PilP [Smithellaceae bacterium]
MKRTGNKIIGGLAAALLLSASLAMGASPAVTPKPAVSRPALPAVNAKSTPPKQEVKVSSVPAPATTAAPTFSFSPGGKPNPFQPFLETDLSKLRAAQARSKVKMETRTKMGYVSPLQSDEISHFRLVGVASDKLRRVAMLEDQSGRFYPLFIGTLIGPNNGKVVAILPDRVIVEERGRTSQKGKENIKRITMKLYKE